MNDKADCPPKITVCVGAVVLRQDEVLFVRQAYGDLLGKWSLPWGFVDGFAPNGLLETPDAAVLRETLEEAGVTVEIEGLLGIQNHSNEQGELRLYLLYLCCPVSGDPTPDHHETDQAAYYSLDDLDATTETFDEFCLWLARRVLRGEYKLIQLEPLNPYSPHLAFL